MSHNTANDFLKYRFLGRRVKDFVTKIALNFIIGACSTISLFAQNDEPFEIQQGGSRIFSARANCSGATSIIEIEPDLPSYMSFSHRSGSIDPFGNIEVQFRISVSSSAPLGTKRVEIRYKFGTAGTVFCSELFSLEIKVVERIPAPSMPVLIAPPDSAHDVPVEAKLVWSAAAFANDYQLQVSKTPTFSSRIIDESGIADTNYTVTGLINGQSYFWRARAKNSSGTSPWSAIWRFTTTLDIGLGWTPVISGTRNGLQGVCFINNNTGTVVGYNGTILRTIDSGVTWAAQLSGTTNTLVNVSFSNADTGTVVGWNGTILRTTNAGHSWIAQESGIAFHHDLYDIDLIDSQIGYAVGGFLFAPSIILKTTDGGTSWTTQTNETWILPLAVDFTDANTGTVVGVGGQILRTTDGGENWIEQSSDVTADLWDVSFADQNIGIAVGKSGTILRTMDGGDAWVKQESGTLEDLYGVACIDTNLATVVGSAGTVLATTDGGLTWILQETGSERQTLHGISFASEKIGFAVGTQGTVLRTQTGGIVTTVDQYINGFPEHYSLSQNYPNPFNPKTTIRYTVAHPGRVILKIYNVRGREVATLIDEFKPVGVHQTTWEAARFASGVYFYRLQAGDFAATRKFILQK